MRIKWKLAIIAGILVLLAVPLLLVVSKIYERSEFRDAARADIARSWTGARPANKAAAKIPILFSRCTVQLLDNRDYSPVYLVRPTLHNVIRSCTMPM